MVNVRDAKRCNYNFNLKFNGDSGLQALAAESAATIPSYTACVGAGGESVRPQVLTFLASRKSSCCRLRRCRFGEGGTALLLTKPSDQALPWDEMVLRLYTVVG